MFTLLFLVSLRTGVRLFGLLSDFRFNCRSGNYFSQLIQALLAVSDLVAVDIAGDQQLALLSDLAFLLSLETYLDFERQGRVVVNIPAQDSLAVDLVDVLTAGPRTSNK